MAQRPRSIVFLTPGFPADSGDTACLPAVQNYVAGVAAEHPELHVHVIAFQYPFQRRTYPWKGATVHALAGRNRRGLLRLWTWLLAAHAFLKIHAQTRIRVLHSFWLTECTWVGQWLSKCFHIQHVATIAGQDATARNPFLKYLDLHHPTITAGSAFAGAAFMAHTGRRVDHIIPLGLDTAYLQQIEQPAGRDIDLLGVGALVPLKNFALFIDLAERLLPRFPHLQACLIGEGPERGDLEQRIRSRGLQQHVRLTGGLRREEVFQHMLRSKILLHPSRYEAQGYVFLEALFAGLHVVSFDVGYAGCSDRVFRCASAQQMERVLEALLRRAPNSWGIPVLSVAETVQAYRRVYDV